MEKTDNILWNFLMLTTDHQQAFAQKLPKFPPKCVELADDKDDPKTYPHLYLNASLNSMLNWHEVRILGRILKQFALVQYGGPFETIEQMTTCGELAVRFYICGLYANEYSSLLKSKEQFLKAIEDFTSDFRIKKEKDT